MEQVSLFDEQISLRPLQEYSLNEIRNAFRKTKRLVYQAPTGLGKTIIAGQIIKNTLQRGKTALFIADRIVLCNQTSDVFLKYGIPHGVMQSDNPRWDINQPCQVCSIQTLKSRGTPQADVIIIDEAHCLHAEHKKIMRDNPESFILGLTATPYQKGMGKYFDDCVCPVTMKQAIENKYLVPFEIYGPSIADLSKLKITAGEYTEESNVEVFDKADIIGDVIETWKKITPGKKTIVFGANIAHIKHLNDRFNDAGISSCQINAYQSDEERQTALKGFTQGDTMILCSVEVATKGFDCPAVEVAILAVATRSMIKWTQTTGRALRTFNGKEKAIILDFGGNAERLGWPDDYKHPGLDDGKSRKNKKTDKERPEQLPKACPSCDFIKPVGVRTCPACGFTPEFKKDVEVSEGELEKLKRKDRKNFTADEKQRFLAQLNDYRIIKGYAWGWAIHKYVDKFGCQPSSQMDWHAREPITAEVKGFITHCNIRWAKGKNKQAA